MPSEKRFGVIKKMLEDKGYTFSHVRGSHHIFTKPDTCHFSVPVHNGKVKPYYVKQIEKL